MNRLRKASILFLCISAAVGLIRGYRMTGLKPVLFQYPEEAMKMTVFSNYNLFGWIIFCLLGVFSVVTLIFLLFNKKIYSYLIICEGVFGCFFTLTHLLYTGFGFIHIIMLPFAIGMIALGILQTPKDFDTTNT